MRWYQQPWLIPLACCLLLIASTTFDVVWLLNHHQVVTVNIYVRSTP